ncbi:DUF2115 domain-containing protein [Methanobrevibacter sp.]|uniref:DUF2115 domain-containing protein n=1 Tax=Methanobrevibacter sp. TaxID=66852 RepID=UPI0038909F40
MSLYEDFSDIVIGEEKVSPQAILDILKEYSATISVFDLMKVNAEMIEDGKYIQENYRDKSHAVYAKYFLGRIREIRNDDNSYDNDVDKEEFIDAVATLKTYHENESITSKTKFPLIYAIVSLYTTFVLEEPIHPVGTPFPGSLKVEEKDGVFYCPVKEANLESPNAVCKMCIAEQLDF